ncbi:MAG: response regulator [Chthoniobacteraceae bacterium]|jgi:PAS domain S-box-containing protein
MIPISRGHATQAETHGAPEALFEPETTEAVHSLNAIETEPINILIVDDEPKNLIALETVLEDPAYRLVRANSADEALLALVSEEFALLVLDIQMPGMNGFELAHMIKQRKRTACVPIIFLTAYFSEDEHVMEGYSTGAVDYLHKPINAAVLRSKVAVFATLHRKTRQSELANQALIAEIAERHRTQDQLRQLNADLERRVATRTSELSESEARFRALAEDMPHLVWESDPDGLSTYQNAKWRNYTGIAREITRDDWPRILHPQDSPSLISEWEKSIETGSEFDTYCRLRRAADGAYRWFQIKAAPVRNSSGAIIRWVGTCTDVHEQRKAEEALVEADKRKDEFLAMLGHELRNPLAAIRQAVSITENISEDPGARQWAAAVIDRQTAQLSRMVDDLLDVERINRGRIDLRLEALDLDAVLARAIEAVRAAMEQKGHTLVAEIDDPGLRVNGDSARLEQVFVNLLGNAVKYTPEHGRIRLSARRDHSEVVISVADNGIGISPDLLPHVFKLFTQGETSLDRAEGGLGIGLTVVKSLVEMHGGFVEVLSAGKQAGAEFIVRLPLLPAESSPSGSTPVGDVPGDLPAGLRVLIVDDHIDAAQTLALLLSRRNCKVRVTHDGPSAIVAAREFDPQVFLLDLGLPGLDGYEIAATLRADSRFRTALFVAISGYAQDADRARTLAAGFDCHCAKPVDFPTLLSVIRARFLRTRS